MTTLPGAVDQLLAAQAKSRKPLAIILAGHNGSGKSTLWYDRLAGTFQIPLVNADRIMMSVLPEPNAGGALAPWASQLRDKDRGWMSVAQKGVEAFVGHATSAKVPFAMETVFSHWKDLGNGQFESKIDRIIDLQAAGYFVLLLFVGLSSAELSILRVATRVARGGHGIPETTLRERYPRTQKAISHALNVADASILTDNSGTTSEAFTVCRIQIGTSKTYDIRDTRNPPATILSWMPKVAPPP